MKFETLKYNKKEKIGYIILNRPDRLNSFDMKLGRELLKILEKIENDKEIRAIVLTGIGKGFCAGGDVKEMYNAKDKSKFLKELTEIIHKCVIKMRTMEKPVIASINGAAFGAGLSLALACDIIISVKKAKFGTAFIGIGLAPGCGTQFFTKITGYQKACEYILTSKTFTAETAEKIGIINDVVEEKDLEKKLDEYLNKFRVLPPIAVGKAKMLINKSLENNMINHLDLESKTAANAASTKDFEEGVSAFVEKRKPLFIGK